MSCSDTVCSLVLNNFQMVKICLIGLGPMWCMLISLMIDSYVLMIVSLFLPHDLPVRYLHLLVDLYSLVLVYLMHSLNGSFK